MYARVETDVLEVLPDADLVRRYKIGNDEALDVLLARHSEALYRFCCHLVSNREDAEDICQETLTRAMTRVESLQAGAAFRSWLFSIARNLSVDSFRSRKRTCPFPDEELSPLPLYENGPHERVEAGEERETVAQALSQLRESHQRVLMLREVEGLSYAEIAQTLDVSQSAVETLLFRARRRLREEYSKREMPLGGLVAAGGIRDLLVRLASPFAGGPPLAAKLTLSAALVAGTSAAVPVALHQGAQPLGQHRPALHRSTGAPSWHGKRHTAGPSISSAQVASQPRGLLHPPIRPSLHVHSGAGTRHHSLTSGIHSHVRSVHPLARTHGPAATRHSHVTAHAPWKRQNAHPATPRPVPQASATAVPPAGPPPASSLPAHSMTPLSVKAGTWQGPSGQTAAAPATGQVVPPSETKRSHGGRDLGHVSGVTASEGKHGAAGHVKDAPAVRHASAGSRTQEPLQVTAKPATRAHGHGIGSPGTGQGQPTGAQRSGPAHQPASAGHGRGHGAPAPDRSGGQQSTPASAQHSKGQAQQAVPGGDPHGAAQANGRARGHAAVPAPVGAQSSQVPAPAAQVNGASAPGATGAQSQPAAGNGKSHGRANGHAAQTAPVQAAQPSSAVSSVPQTVPTPAPAAAAPVSPVAGQSAPVHNPPAVSAATSAPDHGGGRADAPGQADKGTPAASVPSGSAAPQVPPGQQKDHGNPHP